MINQEQANYYLTEATKYLKAALGEMRKDNKKALAIKLQANLNGTSHYTVPQHSSDVEDKDQNGGN